MMNLRSLRIGARLRIGFGAILALLVVVLVTDNIVSLKNRESLFRGIKSANAKVELTTRMKAAQLEGMVEIRSIGLHSDIAAMNKEEARLKEQRKNLQEARAQLIAMGVSEAGKQIFANIERLYKELDALSS